MQMHRVGKLTKNKNNNKDITTTTGKAILRPVSRLGISHI
jgi:hypothetical protein